ncbi:MAG TPA: HD domain-containing phosphohydrolase [Pedomonas sp.]|uniref:HD-GYP domain-containing protein n=1 Tax=Pedomonas sp. TaxID=2976421 RepID=UPI002F41A5B2
MAISKLNSDNGTLKGQVWVWLAGVGLFFILGLILAFVVANRDRERAEELLEQEMALVASGRAQAVSGWLSDQRVLMERLASNPAVAIYSMGSQAGAIQQGQAQYLGRLLETTAAQTGFAHGMPQLRANVDLPPSPGLAVLSPEGRSIAMYGGPLPDPRAYIADAAKGTVIDYDLRLQNQPVLALLTPVPDPQGGMPVAYVYGVRALENAQPALVTPTERFASARAGLILKGAILVGDADRLPAPAQLAEFAAAPGRLHTYGNALVMVQPVPGTPLHVVRVVDAAEGLEPINTQWRLRLLSLLGLVAFVTALILLAWRHGASQRAAQSAREARQTAEREAQLHAFMATIADRQPTLIGVVDKNGLLRFSNARLRDWLEGGEDMHGVPLAKLFGPAEADISALIAAAGSTDVAEALVSLRDPHGNERRHQVEAVTLPDGDTLLVANDITDLLAERARREANMKALVLALTGLIDARDPGSRHHSEKVSGIAAATAAELGMQSGEVETVRLAGQLMNLGKIMVPRHILLKQGPLTEEERAIVRAAMAQSAGILANVPFDGPVSETIAGVEAPEPPELSRVLRLANALVGMVSPRAFRSPMPLQDAMEQLRRNAQPEDVQILSALSHVLDNRGGRELLGV